MALLDRVLEVRGWSALIGVCLLTVALTGCDTIGSHAAHRSKGLELYRAGDYAAAADRFQQAADRNSTDLASHYWLAVSLMELGRYDAAQLPLEQALAIDPESRSFAGRVRDRLAEVYYRQDRDAKLHAFLEGSVKENGQQPRDFLRQAHYLQKTGDMDGARLALQKAVHFSGGDQPGPYLAMASFYEGINDGPSARRSLEYAYHLDPDNAEAASRLEGYGVVLGPSAGAAPPRPEILAEPIPGVGSAPAR